MTRSRFSSPRPGYRDIALYAADPALCRIDLSDNTNGWGMPPAAARAISAMDHASLARYPDAYAAPLREALSRYTGVAPGMISTGCGSDDILDSAFRAFGSPGDGVAYPDPTFTMIPAFARLNGLVPRPVPMSESLEVDVDGLLDADARIIYLCSPNNPTGSAMNSDAIRQVVVRSRSDQVVIIDEAYFEFGGASAVDLIHECDRVLITRTMSKAFGLAGLRIGYGCASAPLIADVEKSRGPYKVNAIAEVAAVAALSDGLPWVRDHVAISNANRDRLVAELVRRGMGPIRSFANFVLLPIAEAADVARELRARSIAVRSFETLPTTSPALARSSGNALRVSVGPWEQVEAFLGALDEVIS